MINNELVSNFIHRHLKITILLAVFVGFLSYFLTTLFPAMSITDAESISASWPQVMKDLFGDPVYGFSNIYGWMNLELFHITLWMIFGVFATLLASDVIAKEIENKSIDILLSTPVTRVGIITSRIIGIVVLMLTAIFPTYLGCALGTLESGFPIKFDVITITTILLVLLSLVFAAVTILCSVFIPKQTQSAFITIAVFGALFLYEDLAKLVPGLNQFKIISPFHYYQPQNILLYDTFSISDPLILLGMFMVFTMLSMLIFSRKDILL